MKRFVTLVTITTLKYWAEDLWEVLDHYTKDNPLDNNDNDDCDDGEEEDYPDYNWFDD